MQKKKAGAALGERAAAAWTFLSNHAHVLICLARNPDLRLREVALSVGITERGVQKIVLDLEEAGALARHRVGRHNSYDINVELPLRHAVESHRRVGDLLSAVLTGAEMGRLRRKGGREGSE